MDIKTITHKFEQLSERIIEFRRTLHRMAELSFEEHKTSQYIADL